MDEFMTLLLQYDCNTLFQIQTDAQNIFLLFS